MSLEFRPGLESSDIVILSDVLAVSKVLIAPIIYHFNPSYLWNGKSYDKNAMIKLIDLRKI